MLSKRPSNDCHGDCIFKYLSNKNKGNIVCVTFIVLLLHKMLFFCDILFIDNIVYNII